jgi:hypothetical protein
MKKIATDARIDILKYIRAFCTGEENIATNARINTLKHSCIRGSCIYKSSRGTRDAGIRGFVVFKKIVALSLCLFQLQFTIQRFQQLTGADVYCQGDQV